MKKSKILLLSMTLPVFGFAAVPRPITPLVGRFTPAGPILLPEMVLLLLPPATVLVLNRMLPPAVAAVAVDEPSTCVRVTVLFGGAVDEADRARARGCRGGRVGDRERVAAAVQTVDRDVVRAVQIDQRTARRIAPVIVRRRRRPG